MSLERKTRLPAVPDVPGEIDPALADFLRALKETVEVYRGERGDKLDSVVTVRDLWQTGVVNVQGDDGSILSYEEVDRPHPVLAARGEGQGVAATPATPTGLQVTPTTVNVLVEWDQPSYPGHWQTEIWRSQTNDLGQAVKIGVSRTLLFWDALGLTNTTRYYWVRHVNVAGVPGPYNSGPTSGASATTGLVQDSDIQTVAAEKIVAAQLSTISANIGAVTAGMMRSADNTMQVDLDNKQIVIAGPNGMNADDYVILTNGRLEFYKYVSGVHYLYKAVKHRESGVANSGDTVTIPGYFDAQPEIVISPRSLKIFDSANSAQDQVLSLQAQNVQEVTPGSGQWQFTAHAELQLAASGGTTTVNNSSGSTSSDTWTSGTYTTPSNVDSITVNVSMMSVRGTGTQPNYYYRKVDWRVAYKTTGSGTWSYTSYQTKNIGAVTSGTVTDSMTISGLTPGAYDIKVEFIAADAGGTFSSGGITYDYSTETLSLAGTQATASVAVPYGSSGWYNSSMVAMNALPASTVNPSWEIYKLVYSCNHKLLNNNSHSDGGGKRYGATNAYLYDDGSVQLQALSYDYYTSPSGDYTQTVAYSKTIEGSSLTYNRTYFQVKASGKTAGSPYGPTSYSYVLDPSVTIYRRNPQPNSTTADNTFTFDHYDYTTASSTVLASGTLNWIALGE